MLGSTPRLRTRDFHHRPGLYDTSNARSPIHSAAHTSFVLLPQLPERRSQTSSAEYRLLAGPSPAPGDPTLNLVQRDILHCHSDRPYSAVSVGVQGLALEPLYSFESNIQT